MLSNSSPSRLFRCRYKKIVFITYFFNHFWSYFVFFSLSYSPLYWASLLKSEARVELISDPTLYLWFERMKRGGLSYVGNRYAEANVPWDTANYDPTKETCHLMYVGKLG